MKTVLGKHSTAVCFCDELEETAEAQIKSVCDQEFFAGSKIRIMPDVHGGMGCSIGTTMTITDKVVPGMVGVDIGCGMETVSIEEKSCDFEKLDRIIRAGIPSGRDVRATTHHLADEIDLSELRCASHVNQERARRSIGSLGGGNHFIEIDKSNYGTLYIVIHSGSRHIGNEVARYYQDEGFNALCGNAMFQINEMIALLKAEGREREIHDTLSEMRRERKPLRQIPHDLAYIEGSMFDDYIHDMKIIQRFAVLNRKAMMDVILSGMGFSAVEEFTTIHNYIDTDAMILRKGAVSAKTGEKLLIPINMRDGSLICIGKGNKEWNYSAPHGAGRIMSRKSAFKTLSMEQYKEKMAGIFTTCVNPDTLDESPMAYKEMGTIVKNIAPTVDIIDHVKPMYNFKACE